MLLLPASPPTPLYEVERGKAVPHVEFKSPLYAMERGFRGEVGLTSSTCRARSRRDRLAGRSGFWPLDNAR